MTFSIQEQIVCSHIKQEESISESNLLLSQTLQSFCKEATSCSAIFALATGQAIGLLAKSESFKYFSLLCKTGSTKIRPYYASSVLGIIAEGISFPLATKLGKNEEIEIGNFGSNFHGIVTLALCKTIGKKLSIQNLLLQHVVQDCAMVSFDMSCEFFGIIEQRSFSATERLLDAELASIRIEASMKLLTMSCSGFSAMQAKRELGFEFEMGVKGKEKVGNPKFGNSLFSPEMITSNGFLVKVNTEKEVSSRNFSIQAKDLRMMAEGNRLNERRRVLEVKTGYSETDEIFLDLLPQTSQERLREVRTINEKLASLLLETWNELCAHPAYLKNVYDREMLLEQYEVAAKVYLRKTGRYSEEQIGLLIEYGNEVFFRRVPVEEYFHIEDRSVEAEIVDQEEVEIGKPSSRRSQSKQKKKTGPQHTKKEKKLVDVQPIEKKLATFEEYEDLKREQPELARSVQVSLASWSGVLDGVKEKHPHKFQELTGESQAAFDAFELNTRRVLRRLIPPVPVQTIYEDVLPIGFKFRHLHKEISSSYYGLKIGDYYRGPLFSHLNVDSATELPIVNQPFPEWLQKRLAANIRGSDPNSALYILAVAMAQSRKTLTELIVFSHVDLKKVLENLEADPKSRWTLDPQVIVRMKTAFKKLEVSFDTAKFCRDLYPEAVELFPDLLGDTPYIVLTAEQFRRAHFFNIGYKLLSYRLNKRLRMEDISTIMGIGVNTYVRYEMNISHIVEDKVLTAALDELLKLPLQERRVAYFASRPFLTELFPIKIRRADYSLRDLTREEAERFHKSRKKYLNADCLRDEVGEALSTLQIAGETELANYMKRKGLKASYARKVIFLGEVLTDSEVVHITDSFGFSYQKWRRHYDLSLDSYFLGIDRYGNVQYPTSADFKKLEQIPACSPKLLSEKYPEVKEWNELPLEQKWHLYLVQIILSKFGNNYAGVEKTGIKIIRSYGQFRSSIINRTWTNETMAQFANSCELTPDERALLYMYFRQKSLMKKI